MIGRLHGTLIEKEPPQLMLDVGGVGYEVEASMNTFYALPGLEQAVTLFIHMVVREDAQLLYGFGQRQERQIFRVLLRVNGVGPRVALAILSTLSVPELVQCVERDEVSVLVRVPGIGKKTAERLIVELRDRLDDFSVPAAPLFDKNGDAAKSKTNGVNDAVSALVSLGYKQNEALKTVKSIDDATQLDSETLIRQSLSLLAKK